MINHICIINISHVPLLYLCACVCIWACECQCVTLVCVEEHEGEPYLGMCAFMLPWYIPKDNFNCHCLGTLHLIYWDRSLISLEVHWLGMKPRNPETKGSTCTCLHSTKITSTHHHVGFLFSFLNMVSREIKPSPHACKMYNLPSPIMVIMAFFNLPVSISWSLWASFILLLSLSL